METIQEEVTYIPMTAKYSRDKCVVVDKIYTEIIDVSNLYEIPRMHGFAGKDEYQNCREYRSPQEHREAPKKSTTQLAHIFRDEQIEEERPPVFRKNWKAIEIPKIKEDEIKENPILTQEANFRNKISGIVSTRNVIYLSVGFLSLIGCASLGSLYLSRKYIEKSNISEPTVGFSSTVGITLPPFEVTTPLVDNISTENSPYRGYKNILNKNNTTKKNTDLTNEKYSNLGLTTKISDGLNDIFIHSGKNFGDDKTKELEYVFKKIRRKFVENLPASPEKERDLNIYLYNTRSEYLSNENQNHHTEAHFSIFEKK